MFYDEARHLIIYEGDETRIAAPLAVRRAGNFCEVPATLRNIIRLTELDLDTPDPMMDYDWPSAPGQEPFPGQKIAASFLVCNRRCFNLSAVRTGKSREVIWAYDYIQSKANRPIHCLIVSDITALVKTWEAEITAHLLGRRTCKVLYGKAEERVQALNEEADFYLLNHDALRIGRPEAIPQRDELGHLVAVHDLPARSLYKALLDKRFEIVVFDEASSYRDHRTKMHKCARAISKDAIYVWLLTGTPCPNGPLDAYGLKRLCHPNFKVEQIGGYPAKKHFGFFSYRIWEDQVTYADGPFRRIPKRDSTARVDELLSPAIRISQEQCFTPTGLVGPVDIKCPLTDEQREAMKELKRDLILLLEDGAQIDAVNEAALRAKLIQISAGMVYDSGHAVHPIDARPRVDNFKDLVQKINGKTLVFAPLISVIEMLAKEISDQAMVIRHSMTRNQKLAALREWQFDESKKVLLSHPGPIARGIDLSAANHVVWFAPSDRTEWWIQANERINGINQDKTRYIYRLSGCAIEDEIYRRIEFNIKMQGAILKLKEMEI